MYSVCRPPLPQCMMNIRVCVGSFHVTPHELITSKCSRKTRNLTRNGTGSTDEVKSKLDSVQLEKTKLHPKVFNIVDSVLDMLG